MHITVSWSNESGRVFAELHGRDCFLYGGEPRTFFLKDGEWQPIPDSMVALSTEMAMAALARINGVERLVVASQKIGVWFFYSSSPKGNAQKVLDALRRVKGLDVSEGTALPTLVG